MYRLGADLFIKYQHHSGWDFALTNSPSTVRNPGTRYAWKYYCPYNIWVWCYDNILHNKSWSFSNIRNWANWSYYKWTDMNSFERATVILMIFSRWNRMDLKPIKCLGVCCTSKHDIEKCGAYHIHGILVYRHFSLFRISARFTLCSDALIHTVSTVLI